MHKQAASTTRIKSLRLSIYIHFFGWPHHIHLASVYLPGRWVIFANWHFCLFKECYLVLLHHAHFKILNSTLTPSFFRLGRNSPSKANMPPFRCAICQVDQVPFEDLITDDGGGYCSDPSTSWAGPYLCSGCRKKKDAMEGKRSSRSTACSWKYR